MRCARGVLSDGFSWRQVNVEIDEQAVPPHGETHTMPWRDQATLASTSPSSSDVTAHRPGVHSCDDPEKRLCCGILCNVLGSVDLF